MKRRHPFRATPPIRATSPQRAEALCVTAPATIQPRFYLVDGRGGWSVVCARNLRAARSYATEENGHGGTREVRKATDYEVHGYCRQRGTTIHQLIEEESRR